MFNIINDIKKEREPFRQKVLILKSELARKFAAAKTSDKIKVFKELGIDKSISCWMLDNMKYLISNSLKIPWNNNEEESEKLKFFELLFSIKIAEEEEFSEVTQKKCYRFMEAEESNIDLVIKALKLSLNEEISEEWTSFLLSCLSEWQIFSELPPSITDDEKVKRLLNKRNEVISQEVES